MVTYTPDVKNKENPERGCYRGVKPRFNRIITSSRGTCA